MQQFVLKKASGFSGRGIRIEVLGIDQVDSIREEAAKALPPQDEAMPAEARQQAWVAAQKKFAIPAMVVAVTVKDGFKKAEELLALPETDWVKTTVDELTATPEKYFTTKDIDGLGDIYFRLHVSNGKEIDDILGEALDVTAA